MPDWGYRCEGLYSLSLFGVCIKGLDFRKCYLQMYPCFLMHFSSSSGKRWDFLKVFCRIAFQIYPTLPVCLDEVRVFIANVCCIHKRM